MRRLLPWLGVAVLAVPAPVVAEGPQAAEDEYIAVLGRKCRAIEIQPAFVDVALRRWEEATGQHAVLEGTGRTFAEVAEERQ